MIKYYDGKVCKKKMSTSLKVNDSVLKANKKEVLHAVSGVAHIFWKSSKKTMVSNDYIMYSFW